MVRVQDILGPVASTILVALFAFLVMRGPRISSQKLAKLASTGRTAQVLRAFRMEVYMLRAAAVVVGAAGTAYLVAGLSTSGDAIELRSISVGYTALALAVTFLLGSIHLRRVTFVIEQSAELEGSRTGQMG